MEERWCELGKRKLNRKMENGLKNGCKEGNGFKLEINC